MQHTTSVIPHGPFTPQCAVPLYRSHYHLTALPRWKSAESIRHVDYFCTSIACTQRCGTDRRYHKASSTPNASRHELKVSTPTSITRRDAERMPYPKSSRAVVFLTRDHKRTGLNICEGKATSSIIFPSTIAALSSNSGVANGMEIDSVFGKTLTCRSD